MRKISSMIDLAAAVFRALEKYDEQCLIKQK